MKRSRSDQRFDDGALVRSDFRDQERRRTTPHKTAQLCAQIQRALELALQGDCRDPALWDLIVSAVEPLADLQRLRVRFEMTGDAELLGVEAMSNRLEAVRGVLHDAVAAAVHRRRIPELEFCVAGGASAGA